MSSSMLRTRRLSKDNTYFELKQKIIDNELKPGQNVHEESLASLLGVSRTPLREAIQRLENEDFLVRQPNGRLKVAPVTVEELEEIFLVRGMLEGHIAKNAAKNATSQDIQHMTAMVEKTNQSLHLGSDKDALPFGFEFHDYLSEISGLHTFERILSQLRDHTLRYCRYVSLHGEWNSQAYEEHSLILQRIADRDEEGAEKVMQDHISNSLATALKRLKTVDETRKD